MSQVGPKEPYSPSMSLSDCQAACEVDRSCEGFISVSKNDEPGPCYKRKNLQPWECENEKYHSLFIKVGGM